VLEYIETLKQQAIEDLAAAEQKRERDANTCAANKAAMQNIIEEKQTNLDDVTEHLTWLNGEFADAEARVAFVQARILAIKTKYDNLKKQSCASNFLFVQDLKEHKDAMDLLQILEEEINSYFSQKS
jgi:predicted nuclease with TOPRIM domain